MRNKPHVPILPLNQSTANPENNQLLNSPSSEDDELSEFKEPENKPENIKYKDNILILEEFRTLIKDKDKDSIETFFENHPYILHTAAEHREKGLVEEILKLKPKSIDAVIGQNLTVLHSAVLGIANIEIFKILLKTKPTLIDIPDKFGKTLVYYGETRGFGGEILTDNITNTRKIAKIFSHYAQNSTVNNSYVLCLYNKALELLGINNDVEE
ncbi:ankyrin repeat domain-containing protein [Rickettsia endosymbiont of Polydrusus tereticollis]|uniref:ankyrin repeat domain-containing protein n=1 Tax=Rickettsia endosymbiont of Polydrusus tereticollis TaxID=3066251 RepID=UPI0031332B9F